MFNICNLSIIDSMEKQFSAMHENPDIIIATPGKCIIIPFRIKLSDIFFNSPNCQMHLHFSGRFVHVCVEMGLKLESIEYVVFDEADRLFEVRTT